MSKRYHLLLVGVYDTVVNKSLTVANTEEWQKYLTWLGEGNTPGPISTPPIDLEHIRREKIAKVNLLKMKAAAKGVIVAGIKFDSDRQSVLSITSRVSQLNFGGQMPSNFTWRSSDNRDIPMNNKKMNDLLTAIVDLAQACHNRSLALKAALTAATDPRTVDIEFGWPT